MKKALLAIPAAAAVLAACGTAMTHSTSTISISKVYAGGAIQVAAGAKAADVSDITNRPNPQVGHGGIITIRPSRPSTPRPATVTPAQSSGAVTSDRCSTGSSSGTLTGQSGTSTAKHPQLPMCAVQ